MGRKSPLGGLGTLPVGNLKNSLKWSKKEKENIKLYSHKGGSAVGDACMPTHAHRLVPLLRAVAPLPFENF